LRQAAAERVIHDHKRNCVEDQKLEDEGDIYHYLTKPVKVRAMDRALKIKNQDLLNEVNYLVDECHLPLSQVAKRLKINYKRLRLIRGNFVQDADLAFQKYKP
jgi:hypothetical protein